MCGIAGYIALGKARPTFEEIRALHILNEVRGPVATGLGYLDEEGGDFAIIKTNRPATEFYTLPEVKRFLSKPPPHLLMHTRAPTQGSAENPLNNHPVVLDQWLVVHNGQIRNDDGLLRHYEVNRVGEVDSFGIVAALTKADTVQNGVQMILGTFAIAAINKNPFQLYLVRDDTKPLSIIADLKRELVFWSSELEHLLEAFPKADDTFPWKGWHLRKLQPWRYWHVPQNTIWLIDYAGIQEQIPFKTDLVKAPSSWTGHVTDHREKRYQQGGYESPHERSLRDIRDAAERVRGKTTQFVPPANRLLDTSKKVAAVICPVIACQAQTSIKWLLINDNICPGCKTKLLMGGK